MIEDGEVVETPEEHEEQEEQEAARDGEDPDDTDDTEDTDEPQDEYDESEEDDESEEEGEEPEEEYPEYEDEEDEDEEVEDDEQVVLAEVVAADPVVRDLRERTRDVPEEVSWRDRVRLGELVARAMEAKREAEAAALWDLVAGHAVEVRESPGAGTDHLADLALLVDDDRVAALEAALETYAEAAYDRVRLSLTGPLPPYDFVEATWA